MVKARLLDFNKNNRLSVTKNPLPNHIRPNVNAIVEDLGLKIKTKVKEAKASMEEIYKVLLGVRVIPKREISDVKKEIKVAIANIMQNV